MFDPFFALLFLAALIIPISALIYWLNPRRRQSRRTGSVLLACAIATVFGFLWYAGPDLWVTNDGMIQMYVIAPEQKAEHFTDQLADISGHFGMKAYVSYQPNFDGTPFHVLESHGKWLRLWSQNMPLDSDLPMDRCGPRLPVDPGQYALMIFRILPFGTERGAKEFSSQLATELHAAGYEVRSSPVKCSPWLKTRIVH